MAQGAVWEREYTHPQLVTMEPGIQADVKRFLDWLKKEQGIVVRDLAVLDVGCGTGRNGNALAALGNSVTGFDIAPTAIRVARERARAERLSATYAVGDMGAPLPYADGSFDLVLDVTSSNSLLAREREALLRELLRVLKPGGYLFVRGLCKEGDKHAKNLLKQSPGPEAEMYRMPGLDLVERVFTETDFRRTYGAFTIIRLAKKANYARFQGRSYKRQYWLAYLQKPGQTTKV